MKHIDKNLIGAVITTLVGLVGMFLIFFMLGCSNEIEFRTCGGRVVIDEMNQKFYPSDCTYTMYMYLNIPESNELQVSCETTVGTIVDTYELILVQSITFDMGKCNPSNIERKK